jgi:2-polyprenyl-6-methoxyphenol hydroxylase-like FAD-dependent oxidoreductase
MSLNTSPDVLIVGAGPVGLFAALSLAEKGVRVEIVDSGLWTVKHSYALALHPQAMQLFERYGLADRILASAYPVTTMGLYDRGGRRAQLQVSDDPKAPLAVLRQDVLEDLLEGALKDRGVQVRWKHEVSNIGFGPDGITAKLDRFEQESRGYIVAHLEWVVASSTTVQAPFVIGADGYNSRVRRAADVAFPEVSPAQYFAVFEFKSNANLANELPVAFGDGDANVLWPLPGGACRWSFQLPEYADHTVELIKQRMEKAGLSNIPTERNKDRLLSNEYVRNILLEDASLKHFIEERAPWFTGSIDEIVWRTIIRFEGRLASAYGKDRLWLAGDAAHLTYPVGIQSMNLGLFEAEDLSTAMSAIVKNGGSREKLVAYNRKWEAQWRTLLNMDGGLKTTLKTDPWVAAQTARLASALPAHGDRYAALAGQLNLTV